MLSDIYQRQHLPLPYSEEELERLPNLDWAYLCTYHPMSTTFMRKHEDKLDFIEISSSQVLDEAFIRDYADRLDWYHVCTWQDLSMSTIREFREYLREHLLNQVLDEAFIREEFLHLNSKRVLQNQVLSEEFLREMFPDVSPEEIADYQVVSKDFAFGWQHHSVQDKANLLALSGYRIRDGWVYGYVWTRVVPAFEKGKVYCSREVPHRRLPNFNAKRWFRVYPNRDDTGFMNLVYVRCRVGEVFNLRTPESMRCYFECDRVQVVYTI